MGALLSNVGFPVGISLCSSIHWLDTSVQEDYITGEFLKNIQARASLLSESDQVVGSFSVISAP